MAAFLGRPLNRRGPRNLGRAGNLGRGWGGAVLGGLALLGAVAVVGAAPAGAAVSPRQRVALHLEHLEHVQHLAHARVLRARAPAWQVVIPSIGVAAELATLGDPDGPVLPVPPLAEAATEAGWYRFTSVPGSVGNSVIVGHVDTYVGPAVFYDLYRLRPGDPIYITTGSGTERFGVRWIRELPKAQFPVNQVFGSTGQHQLWLITCGGAFDYQTGHYLDNIIVSAAWQPPAKRVLRSPATRHRKPKKQRKKTPAHHRARHR